MSKNKKKIESHLHETRAIKKIKESEELDKLNSEWEEQELLEYLDRKSRWEQLEFDYE